MTNMINLKAYLQVEHEQSDYINWDLDIVVCRSAAGYYIGMMDTDGCPYARFSQQYWATEEQAQQAMDTLEFVPKLWL